MQPVTAFWVKHLLEIIVLSLQESYCLPVLEYHSVAILLCKYQVLELNVCSNSAFRKIFGFAKHECGRAFIFGLSRLDLLHLRMVLNYKMFEACAVQLN